LAPRDALNFHRSLFHLLCHQLFDVVFSALASGIATVQGLTGKQK